jgi:hypothetical protein
LIQPPFVASACRLQRIGDIPTPPAARGFDTCHPRSASPARERDTLFSRQVSHVADPKFVPDLGSTEALKASAIPERTQFATDFWGRFLAGHRTVSAVWWSSRGGVLAHSVPALSLSVSHRKATVILCCACVAPEKVGATRPRSYSINIGTS